MIVCSEILHRVKGFYHSKAVLFYSEIRSRAT